MIEFQNTTKVFPAHDREEITAVQDLDLTVREGEIHCLLGTSGCGKTTTLRMVNRLEEPTRGRILLDGTDVVKTDVIRLRRRIGYVIQSGGIFPHLTVEQNVGLVCKLEGWSTQKTNDRIHELLELVNLPHLDFGRRYPDELSGGQRQRVGVARALALDPDYVLMDEPFGALDPITRGRIHEEFLRLQRDVRKTILFVTHDVMEATKLGDRISLMHQGRLVQSGTPEDLAERPIEPLVTEFLTGHLRTEP